MVELLVGGMLYGGWKSVRVTRGIEAVCGGFDLSLTERWSEAAEWPINEGDECSVRVNGVTVITGYVDRHRTSFSASAHSVEVSGRDRTGDIVDSSAVLKVWEFYNRPVLSLAAELAKPFGVKVTLQPGLDLPPPAARLSVDPGDTVYEVIERACRTAALLPVADGLGGLRLTRTDTARTHTSLVEGENLLSGSADRDTTGRYRKVIVRGQQSGTDALTGEKAAAVQASAEDENVQRASRVLLVRPSGNVTAALAKKRAEWETTVRAARALTVSVTVQGWTQGNGALWPVNALVAVRSPKLKLDEDLLITQVTYSLDESSGTRTELTLRPADAYKPEPVIGKKKKKATVTLGGA